MLHATIHAAGDGGQWLPLDVTFEEAAAVLETLPRMYFEPDGSFVWVAPAGEIAWQLDGQLQDRGDRLDHVEIKGTCAPAACQQLLAALRGKARGLVFQLVEQAVFVDEAAALVLLRPATTS